MSYFIPQEKQKGSILMKERNGKGIDTSRRGALTVEAALALPLMICLMVGLMYFMQFLMLQENIQASITEVGKFASRYGYVYQQIQKGEENSEKEEKQRSTIVEQLVDGVLFQGKFLEYIGTKSIQDSCIVGGIKGVTFFESSFMKDGEEIEVVARYTVRFPIMFFEYYPFTVVQRVRTRGFIGRTCDRYGSGMGGEKEGEEERLVYITPSGRKYHENENCTYLKVRISTVQSHQIEQKRNDKGGKYYACRYCRSKKGEQQGSYYITAYGDRYHTSKTCSRIERTIRTIPFSKVGSRTGCSKCSK